MKHFSKVLNFKMNKSTLLASILARYVNADEHTVNELMDVAGTDRFVIVTSDMFCMTDSYVNKAINGLHKAGLLDVHYKWLLDKSYRQIGIYLLKWNSSVFRSKKVDVDNMWQYCNSDVFEKCENIKDERGMLSIDKFKELELE